MNSHIVFSAAVILAAATSAAAESKVESSLLAGTTGQILTSQPGPRFVLAQSAGTKTESDNEQKDDSDDCN